MKECNALWPLAVLIALIIFQMSPRGAQAQAANHGTLAAGAGNALPDNTPAHGEKAGKSDGRLPPAPERTGNRSIAMFVVLPLIGVMAAACVILLKRRSLNEKKRLRDDLEGAVLTLLTRMENLNEKVEEQRRAAKSLPQETKSKYFRPLTCLTPGSVKEVLDRLEALHTLYTTDLQAARKEIGEVETAVTRIEEAVALVQRLSRGS